MREFSVLSVPFFYNLKLLPKVLFKKKKTTNTYTYMCVCMYVCVSVSESYPELHHTGSEIESSN